MSWRWIWVDAAAADSIRGLVLEEMLSERKKLSEDVQSILEAQTETWGIKVSNVEIRTVELTENLVRAIAKQADADSDVSRPPIPI